MDASRLLAPLALAAVVAGCQLAQSAPTTGAASAVAPAALLPSATASPAAVPSARASIDGNAVVVTVNVTGGECATGPCGAEYVVHADGRIDAPPAGPRSIPAAAVTSIITLAAATDWDAVRAVPFTGQCPTAYDGQKHVYAFRADTGDLVFDSCQFDLSGVPVFRAIDAALFGG